CGWKLTVFPERSDKGERVGAEEVEVALREEGRRWKVGEGAEGSGEGGGCEVEGAEGRRRVKHFDDRERTLIRCFKRLPDPVDAEINV
ncbi:hypothetical protein Avbf_19186, partial [Armadillidium vulgare]